MTDQDQLLCVCGHLTKQHLNNPGHRAICTGRSADFGACDCAGFRLEHRSNQPKPDPVNPAHYRGDLVMRIIETFDLGFELGNVVKYLLRHAAKAGVIDLEKARWYLDRYISKLHGKLPGKLE